MGQTIRVGIVAGAMLLAIRITTAQELQERAIARHCASVVSSTESIGAIPAQ